MSYIGQQYPDAVTFFSGAVSTPGFSSAFNTTGYDGLVFQVEGGSWSGIITAEGSNDGTVWYPLLVTKLSELAIKTQIDINGNWTIKADTLYVRYNVTNLTGTVTLVVIGNNSVISTAADRLALAMDPTNNTPLYTAPQPGTTKQDSFGALIPSDSGIATPTAQIYVAINAPVTIDTTGYQSISITTGTFAGGVTASNDGVTFAALYGYAIQTPLTVITAIAGATTNHFPCTARFIRFTATTAGTLTYYLRQQPFTSPQPAGSIMSIGGTAVITGGVAGVLGVGGPNTAGAATTTNPNQIGGVDSVGIVRRAISDPVGRLNTIVVNSVLPSSNAAIGISTTAIGQTPIGQSSFVNQIPVNVQDSSNFEGQTQTEILALILQELKILNQQIFELPRIQAGMFNGYQQATYATQPQLGDEPAQMRNDASLFGQQQ